MNNINKPHIHADLIKAWADGATIQFYHEASQAWFDVPNNRPCWYEDTKHRVKPKVKIKVKRWRWLLGYNGVSLCSPGYLDDGDYLVTKKHYTEDEINFDIDRYHRWEIIQKIDASEIEVEQ